MAGRQFLMQRMYASDQAYFEDPARSEETGFVSLAPNDPNRPAEEVIQISLATDDPIVLWKGALG